MRSTRMCSWVFALFLASLSAGLQACLGGEDGCEGCECTNSCPDGGPALYGSLAVTSTPVEGAAITLDGTPTGQVTPYTFPNLSAGTHSVLLSFPGRLQDPLGSNCAKLPCPAEVNVTTEGSDVNIILYRDLTGRWRRESDGSEVDIVMWDRDQILAYPPASACPDTEAVAHNFQPLGALCVEADETLSLCKTRASECGDLWVEGRILEDGRRVEYTKHQNGVDYSAVYRKLD